VVTGCAGVVVGWIGAVLWEGAVAWVETVACVAAEEEGTVDVVCDGIVTGAVDATV
jgi:hypothetical protein